jgi:hypothetical protein
MKEILIMLLPTLFLIIAAAIIIDLYLLLRTYLKLKIKS